MSHKTFRFFLDIPYQQFLSVYQGIHSSVRTRATNGQIIEFPARKLQPFLSKQGIQGYFELTVTGQNKFVTIRKL